MTPNNWKDFINKLFVKEDGTRQRATITLKIIDQAGHELEIPNISVAHTDRLVDIFKKIGDTSQQAEQAPVQEAPKKLKVMNIEHITYRNKEHKTLEYIVRRMEDDSFVVVILSTGETIEAGTATHKGVVKKYKKNFLS